MSGILNLLNADELIRRRQREQELGTNPSFATHPNTTFATTQPRLHPHDTPSNTNIGYCNNSTPLNGNYTNTQLANKTSPTISSSESSSSSPLGMACLTTSTNWSYAPPVNRLSFEGIKEEKEEKAAEEEKEEQRQDEYYKEKRHRQRDEPLLLLLLLLLFQQQAIVKTESFAKDDGSEKETAQPQSEEAFSSNESTNLSSHKPLVHLRDHIPKSRIRQDILGSKSFVKLAIRRKYSTKRKNNDTKQSKLHIKSLKAGIKIKLTLSQNLFALYHSLIPFTDERRIYPLFQDEDSISQLNELLRDKVANYANSNDHNISSHGLHSPSPNCNSTNSTTNYNKNLISKGVQLIDNNIVDLSEYLNKIIKSFTNEMNQSTPTFNSLDTAVNTLFQTKDYTLIRITRSTTDDVHGSSILKLETASPGDFNLIDDDENSDEMLHSLGKPNETPNNLFFKKIIARPRYKSNMKIYFIPEKVRYSLYTDYRSFERDLFNGVILVDFENYDNPKDFRIKRGNGYDRNVYCTFPTDQVLQHYKALVMESHQNRVTEVQTVLHQPSCVSSPQIMNKSSNSSIERDSSVSPNQVLWSRNPPPPPPPVFSQPSLQEQQQQQNPSSASSSSSLSPPPPPPQQQQQQQQTHMQTSLITPLQPLVQSQVRSQSYDGRLSQINQGQAPSNLPLARPPVFNNRSSQPSIPSYQTGPHMQSHFQGTPGRHSLPEFVQLPPLRPLFNTPRSSVSNGQRPIQLPSISLQLIPQFHSVQQHFPSLPPSLQQQQQQQQQQKHQQQQNYHMPFGVNNHYMNLAHHQAQNFPPRPM